MVERRVQNDELTSINARLIGHCERMERIEERLEKGAGRMEGIEASLAENTTLTREVVSILADGKAAFRLLGYVGSVAKWLGAIAGAVAAVYAAITLGPDK